MNDFPAFAYSHTMQLILFFISSINTAMNYLGITNLITIVYGQTVSRKRKLLFALITALGLNHFWIYGIFALGGFYSFSPLVYVLVVSPNPIVALLYYWLGVRVLKLSKYRSVRLMRIVYLYVMILRCLGEGVGIIIMTSFSTANPSYNYLLDAISSFTYTAIYLAVYRIILYFFQKNKFQIQLLDSLPIKNLKYELFISFAYASMIYIMCSMIPFYFDTQHGLMLEGYIIVTMFLVYLLVFNTLTQYKRTLGYALDNKNSNIQILSSALDEFSGLKHDFFNMLQTYEGYISLGNLDKLKEYHNMLLNTTTYVTEKLDLAHQMVQNPNFTSVLVEKQQQAAKSNTHLTLKILCNIQTFYIPNEDLCSAVAQLLDIAIREYPTEKNIIFTVDQKANGTKLIMINSSSENRTEFNMLLPKPDIALDAEEIEEVRKILYKYNNVFFHGSFSQNTFFAYTELRCPAGS